MAAPDINPYDFISDFEYFRACQFQDFWLHNFIIIRGVANNCSNTRNQGNFLMKI